MLKALLALVLGVVAGIALMALIGGTLLADKICHYYEAGELTRPMPAALACISGMGICGGILLLEKCYRLLKKLKVVPCLVIAAGTSMILAVPITPGIILSCDGWKSPFAFVTLGLWATGIVLLVIGLHNPDRYAYWYDD